MRRRRASVLCAQTQKSTPASTSRAPAVPTTPGAACNLTDAGLQSELVPWRSASEPPVDHQLTAKKYKRDSSELTDPTSPARHRGRSSSWSPNETTRFTSMADTAYARAMRINRRSADALVDQEGCHPLWQAAYQYMIALWEDGRRG